MMRPYESVVIFAEATTQEQIDTFLEKVKKTIAEEEGSVVIEPWGKRELSFLIKDNRRGHYVMLKLSIKGSTVKAIERLYRIEDSVIRYLTLRADEHDKPLMTRFKRRAGDEEQEMAPVEEQPVDYKRPDVLRRFVSERGKISPRRQSNYSAGEQRRLAGEIKRARMLSLLPFTTREE